MRVFVTGATGFVGSVTVDELLSAGHQVVGLARSGASANVLQEKGAQVLRGTLEDLDVLNRGAADADAVIHLGFVHNFDDFANSCRIDEAAIEALGQALEGTNRLLIVTSGTIGLREGQFATEQDPPSLRSPRKSEVTALKFQSKGVRPIVIRLSPSVHDKGDTGVIPLMIKDARRHGLMVHTGDGRQRWNAVHRLDAAVLYRLALEKGRSGAVYHGAAEGEVAVGDIAQLIGKKLGIPVESKSPEEAIQILGFFAMFMQDYPVSSVATQNELGWKPKEIALLADMEQNYL